MKEIDKDGEIRYNRPQNAETIWANNRDWHKEDSPSYVYSMGAWEWTLYGKRIRVDGPAFLSPRDGSSKP